MTYISPLKDLRAKAKTVLTSPRKRPAHRASTQINDDFSNLLHDQGIPASVCAKLMDVDAAVKQTFLSASSPRKLKRDAPMRETPSDMLMLLDEPSLQTLHKLRVLLRNECISWTKEFLEDGGATKLSQTCRNIMRITRRDDDDDKMLSAVLSCLVAISTTRLGVSYLNSDLLSELICLLFSDKAPAEFTTRKQIIYLLDSYAYDSDRAEEILTLLRDSVQPLAERSLDFLTPAHKPRPYKRWMTELEKPIRDCFWMFLHDNRIAIVDTKDLPQRRKPIVPEGFVGGIEWVAVEYICSHLSFINNCLERLPTADRMILRKELKASNFERLCAQLRKASAQYYVYLHEELTVWTAHAAADSWPVSHLTNIRKQAVLPELKFT